MEGNKRGSEAAIAEIVRMTRGISIVDMARLADQATKAGGILTDVDGDGERCGNGRFKFKWPPKEKEFAAFLDNLVKYRINFEVLINGIPAPDEVMINAKRSRGL